MLELLQAVWCKEDGAVGCGLSLMFFKDKNYIIIQIFLKNLKGALKF